MPTHLPAEESANKLIRARFQRKFAKQKKRERSNIRRKRQREAEQLGDAAPPTKVPRTIEDARVYDEATGKPLTREEALEITDEFTNVLAGDTRPSVVITTGLRATDTSFNFIKQILPVIPNSVYFERLNSGIAQFAEKAKAKDHTDLLVVKEDGKNLSTLTHVHLPDGPTAIYKLSSFVPPRKIRGHGRCTGHTPEVILNNFSTSLGLRIGRMLGSLFPHTPNFVGRQAATFHNQRDFIFFRFHRYVFNAKRDKARLQELGPRFTIKLRGLQKGIYKDPEKAEHEFKWSTKTDVNRRRFFL